LRVRVVITRDSGGRDRAEAAGEIITSPRRSTCDARRGRCGMRVLHAAVACQECGKVYGRCEADGGYTGALRSLHSHRALHHPRVRR
jgi:hypothetical protein